MGRESLKLLGGAVVSGSIIWGMYKVPPGFLLLLPIAASIWLTIYAIDNIDGPVEVTHMMGLTFGVYMPMALLEIVLIFALFYDFSRTVIPVMIILFVLKLIYL